MISRVSFSSWYKTFSLPAFYIPILALLLYANTLTNGFTLDDVLVITKNTYVKEGVKGIPSLVSYDSFHGYFQQKEQTNLVTGGRYRPLSLVLFAVLYQFFGSNPLPFHLLNLLLYVLTAFALLKTFTLITQDNKGIKPAFAVITTLLFVAHPVHTEVVNNIKSADELLSFLFSILSLSFFINGHDKKLYRHFVLSGCLFLLACFSKENALPFIATFPLVIFLFRSTQSRSIPYVIKSLFPVLLAALLYVVVRGEVLHWKFGTESDVLINNPFIKWNGVQWIPFSTAEWSATNMYSLGMYLKILLSPYPLTHDYYPRQFEIMNWSNPHVLLSAVLIVALLTLLFTYRKWNKVILFSIVYFFSTISIVSNFLFPIGTNFSERFVYMPSLGFCAATAFLLSKIPKINIQRFLLLLIIVPYSLLVISRNKDWKNNFSLVEADYPVSSNSAKINNSYAAQLLEIAIKEQSIPERSKLLAQAQLKYSLALKINPTYIEALFGRGSTYFVQGNYSLAVEDYLLAEQIDPNYPSLRTNLVLALREAGKAALKSNDHRTALQYLKAAALRFPNDPEINELVSQISK